MALTDLVELSTTVTAQSGATVTLASVAGLEVGDKIIIESDHGYDETGLDGSWTISNFPTGSGYYTNVTHVGKSFISGAITDITSNVVTVDRTVPSGAVGLPCYRNNFDAVVDTIDNSLPWPSNKSFAVASSSSAPIRCYLTDDYQEIDFNNCELFAPAGCGALGLRIARSGGGAVSNKRYKNLTLRGNARDSGYGFNVETGSWVQGSAQPAAFAAFGTGGDGGNAACNVVIENCHSIDNWRSFELSLAKDCFGSKLTSTATNPLRQYVQWEFGIVSCQRCAFIDCNVDGDYMRAGFEPFKSWGCSYIRCGGRNTTFASNSSGGIVFKDCWMTIDEENPDSSFSEDNPLINLNRTAEEQAGTPITGTDGGIGVFDFVVTYNAIPYPTDGDSGEIWPTIAVTAGTEGIATNAKIYGIAFNVVRTNVTMNNGAATGYVVNNGASNPETYLERVTGDTLDTGAKLNNVTETEI